MWYKANLWLASIHAVSNLKKKQNINTNINCLDFEVNFLRVYENLIAVFFPLLSPQWYNVMKLTLANYTQMSITLIKSNIIQLKSFIELWWIELNGFSLHQTNFLASFEKQGYYIFMKQRNWI